MNAARLYGEVCVVIGAARGTPQAIARRRVAESGRVACLDVGATRLVPAVEQLRAEGAGARAYEGRSAARGGACDVRRDRVGSSCRCRSAHTGQGVFGLTMFLLHDDALAGGPEMPGWPIAPIFQQTL